MSKIKKLKKFQIQAIEERLAKITVCVEDICYAFDNEEVYDEEFYNSEVKKILDECKKIISSFSQSTYTITDEERIKRAERMRNNRKNRESKNTSDRQ